MSARRFAKIAAHLVALAVAAGAIWFYLTYRIGIVPSDSMAPTLRPGDRYLINIRAYSRRPPKRGDVVVFRTPDGEFWVKRVIGLPGEQVTVYMGRVFINGQLLPEPYLRGAPFFERPMAFIVPEGHIFVLGDNRGHSEDSRDIGPVPLNWVVGKAVYILQPPERRGPVK